MAFVNHNDAVPDIAQSHHALRFYSNSGSCYVQNSLAFNILDANTDPLCSLQVVKLNLVEVLDQILHSVLLYSLICRILGTAASTIFSTLPCGSTISHCGLATASPKSIRLNWREDRFPLVHAGVKYRRFRLGYVT